MGSRARAPPVTHVTYVIHVIHVIPKVSDKGQEHALVIHVIWEFFNKNIGLLIHVIHGIHVIP